MKILNETYSKLLHQKVIVAEVSHIGKPTPSEEEIKKDMVKISKGKEELIIIKKIDTKFGSGDSIVTAYVYDSKEDLDKIEPVTKHMKKKAEKPAEAPKQEAPVATPKEEPKVEEKPAEEKKDG